MTIVYRLEFVRCLDIDDESIIVSEMKMNGNNIKPVIIVNSKTKKAVVKKFDGTKLILDDTVYTFTKRIESIADYMINKDKISKSSKNKEEKIKLFVLNEKKHYKKLILTTKEESDFKI